MIRRAAVAGSFYGGTRELLRTQASDLIKAELPKVRVIGAVVPHAGYTYSGRVAGAVYARLAFPMCLSFWDQITPAWGQGWRS